MGIAARQIEQRVVATLLEAGARLVGKTIDGSGHQVVTYRYNGHEQVFHFPHSSKLNGCGPKNIIARLRRMIRETPPPLVVSLPLPVIKSNTPESLSGVFGDFIPPVTPKRPRLTRERRREIAKRYLSLRCISALAGEFKLTFDKTCNVLLSHGGDVRVLTSRELNKRRQIAAQKSRKSSMPVTTVAVVVPVKLPPPAYTLPKVITAQKGRSANNRDRNLQIARLIFRDKVPLAVVAELYDMQPASITRIARDASPLLNKIQPRKTL